MESRASDSEETASESCHVVLWLFPGHTMPRFVQLLSYDSYRYSLMKGLIVSGGELTESLVSCRFCIVYCILSSLPAGKATSS